jgi:serine/threonine-protein kinase
MTAGARYDVWVYDLARGTVTRLASEGSNQFPIWTPDGKRLTYRATRGGTRNVYWRMADGSEAEERLTTGQGLDAPGSWSPDGDVLLYVTSAAGWDILALTLPERRTLPFVQTPFLEGVPQFSPDGRWVAYTSDEFGRQEIYVRPYPGPGGKWQISTDGGQEPVWNPSGRELFYRSGNTMMAVDVTTTPVFAAGRPRPLFTGNYVLAPTTFPNYDVSRDGRRFLMIQPSTRADATPAQIVVVLNWFDELKRVVPK